jgi:hypothetical protein
VSCNPTGVLVSEGALILLTTFATINGANWQRYMLDDGRVFFQSPVGLTPHALDDVQI